jgi:kynurenine formamidase
MPEHIGTNVDAPNHFYPGKRSIDQIPPEHLQAPVVVLRPLDRSKMGDDDELTLQEVMEWESKYGPIPRRSVAVLHSGWDARWGNARRYFNRDGSGVMHFPGFSCDAADYLLNHREVIALGTDAVSIDVGSNRDLCAHKLLFRLNRYAIESLANLGQLPPRGGIIVIAPLKLAGGSGAPARVFATLP